MQLERYSILTTFLSLSAKVSGFAVALVIATAVLHSRETQAQDADTNSPNASKAIEEVVVTGSRITRSGFTTPTPVTVVTSEQLTRSQPLISEVLNELPTLTVGGGRTGGIGTRGSGQAIVSLRGLGANRTLVLLDGRRFVPQNGSGTVDTALMPTTLVRRVEVVTGGASAAYGSDAVAGVVNYVLNTDFTGVKGSALLGTSSRGDRDESKVEIGFGTELAGGRAHLLTSFEFYKADGLSLWDRSYALEGRNLISNPDGAEPRRLVVTDARLTSGNNGGLVVSGPLRGVTFGENGIPRQFTYGASVGTQNQIGGEGSRNNTGDETSLVGDLTRYGMFNRASFDLNESIQFFAENLLSWSHNDNVGGYPYALGSTNYTIAADNAYLPASIRSQMQLLGLETIRVGKTLADLPPNHIDTRLFTWRPTIGADFEIKDWDGEIYYQHGYNRRINKNPDQHDQLRAYNAVDAVYVPEMGAPAGLIPGTIVCRSTLSDPTDGCIPLNVIGVNVASPEAIDYVTRNTLYNRDRYTQDVFAGTISGDALNLWAGALSVAAGLEYRREKLDFYTDPYSQIDNPITGGFGGYRAGSRLPYDGKVTVKEAFVETALPLFSGHRFAESAELNAATRFTEYSTSGSVDTWKVGLTYRPTSPVLLRATRSQDIRAPNMDNLFQAGTSGTATILDPFKGVTTAGVKSITRGNPTLGPETAETLVFGAVFQPTFLDNFSLSVDYWDVEIDGAIAAISNQTVVDECFADQSSELCTFIVRDSLGNLTAIDNRPFNFESLKAEGVDIEASYSTSVPTWSPLFKNGELRIRSLATRMNHFINTAPGDDPDEDAGENTGTTPRWRSLTQLTLENDTWAYMLQAKYISSGVYNNDYEESVDINQNDIASYTIWDTRLGRTLPVGNVDSQIYLTVNNLFDRRPPNIPANGTSPQATNDDLYDEIGRYFRLGISFQF